jgi:ribonuclease E
VETALPQEFVTVPVLTTTSLEAATAPAPGEPASRRPEPELVAVPMDADQELVYGWLGLNPALLLEPQPSSDNLVVRVVRPGDDAEAVLEEARQQLAAAGPRRRRRGRGGSGEAPGNGRSGHGDGADAEEGGSSAGPVAAPVAAPTPLPVTVEITPLEEFTPIPVLSDASIEVRSTRSLDAPAPAPTRGGRSRSRSSAAAPVAVASTTAVLPVIPVVAVQAEPVAEAAAEPDSGEPRRRRRRSSASD